MTTLPRRVRIVEVGPRDGLQNESPVVATNMKGLERALETGIGRIAVFTAASETFNRKNINMGMQESIDGFKPVVSRALKDGISVRGYVSTCFVCPYEG